MPKVHSDPENLRQFAQALQNFSENIESSTSRLDSALNNLHNEWRDQMYDRFVEDFHRSMHGIRAFLRTYDGHVKLLRSKAGILDDFLR